MDSKQKYDWLIAQVVKVAQSNARIKFPEQESDYDQVHMQIHRGIEIFLPGCVVGDGKDTIAAGGDPLLYEKLHDELYYNDSVRQMFDTCENDEHAKMVVFNIMAQGCSELLAGGVDAQMISRVYHDALQHHILRWRGLTLPSFCELTRTHMLSAFYQCSLADFKKLSFLSSDIPSVGAEDFICMRQVIKQFEFDVGVCMSIVTEE